VFKDRSPPANAYGGWTDRRCRSSGLLLGVVPTKLAPSPGAAWRQAVLDNWDLATPPLRTMVPSCADTQASLMRSRQAGAACVGPFRHPGQVLTFGERTDSTRCIHAQCGISDGLRRLERRGPPICRTRPDGPSAFAHALSAVLWRTLLPTPEPGGQRLWTADHVSDGNEGSWARLAGFSSQRAKHWAPLRSSLWSGGEGRVVTGRRGQRGEGFCGRCDPSHFRHLPDLFRAGS